MRRSSRSLFWILILTTALCITHIQFAGKARERPNVVMIVVDDLRFDETEVGGHPYLKTPNINRLAEEGARFTAAYHATPLCSPNRASILTGQYASRHGILDNTSRSHASYRLDLFPKVLQKSGYKTAHVGKWHMGNEPKPRPGYDYWVSIKGQGKTMNPDIYENGKFHQVEGYITDIFTDRAIDFIQKSKDSPFFVYIGHKALHPEAKQLDDGTVDLNVPREFIPAPRHRGQYESKVIDRRPNYGFSEEERKSKPVLRKALEIRNELEKTEKWAKEIDPGIAENTIRRRAEMMLAVDEGVGRILDTLNEMEILDKTVFIFTSDNGYFYGEHGLTIERRLPYEESVRTPLLIRYPEIVKPGTQIDSLVLSIDFAPTVLDLADCPIPDTIQGTSMKSILSGQKDKIHNEILIEFYSHENPFPWTANLDYRIIRKGKYKYIRWLRFEDQAELYNMEADPYEQHNLINDPDMAGVIEELNNDMQRLVLYSLGLAE